VNAEAELRMAGQYSRVRADGMQFVLGVACLGDYSLYCLPEAQGNAVQPEQRRCKKLDNRESRLTLQSMCSRWRLPAKEQGSYGDARVPVPHTPAWTRRLQNSLLSKSRAVHLRRRWGRIDAIFTRLPYQE
jgi:hypothetical protein